MSWLLWPVLFLCFAYSWAFRPVVSWYSWVLATLARCVQSTQLDCAGGGGADSVARSVVYSFGFLAMTPQVYVNYRLRSVAHMPWAALVYSALNTFIDDLFAFLIKVRSRRCRRARSRRILTLPRRADAHHAPALHASRRCDLFCSALPTLCILGAPRRWRRRKGIRSRRGPAAASEQGGASAHGRGGGDDRGRDDFARAAHEEGAMSTR